MKKSRSDAAKRPKRSNKMKVTIPERTFERLLSATKHSVANGDPREELCHIKLTVTKNSITAFSCDGYRASKITFEAEADEDFVIWIKPFFLRQAKAECE